MWQDVGSFVFSPVMLLFQSLGVARLSGLGVVQFFDLVFL
jgi:hypothetical protein